MRVTQRIGGWWLLVAFLGGIATAMMAEELILRAQGNRLNFTVPRVHFFSGRSLERMKDGDTVAYDFHATLASGKETNIVREGAARFQISYDLWEERFQVDEFIPARKTMPRLTAREAEAWCLQELSLDLGGLDAGQSLWARVEIRAEQEREGALFGPEITEAGISLTRPIANLIEQFSQLPPKSQPRWLLEAGPVTLQQLRRRGG